MAGKRHILAILGGTGALGGALAQRWAAAGHAVIIGSRSAARAQAFAAELGTRELGPEEVRGMANRGAAAAAEIVVLTVPYAHHRAILREVKPALQGKILVDVTVPLAAPRVSTVKLPAGGSVAKAAQTFLGDAVRVVSAFHNIAAEHLAAEHLAAEHLAGSGAPAACDILVCGNDAAAREVVIGLVEAADLRGWHAGPIDNSAAAEALTSVLIYINRRYKVAGAGIRITGMASAAAAAP